MKEQRDKPEFDSLADGYYEQHKSNIAITGEGPEFFAEYKIKDFAELFLESGFPKYVLDFGSGIGNSLVPFRKYFSSSRLCCADVSERSLEIAKKKYPGNEKYIVIDRVIPSEDNVFDAVFTACVFHHIQTDMHRHWISELYRVMKNGGMLAVYEHNPFNPLTVHAVNTCPLDVNAHLIKAGEMRRLCEECGWRNVRIEYKMFFPHLLESLRFLEKYLTKCCWGAQWRLTAVT
ncbi:MAG: methyltransferase domain-containing protein [Desulfovibrio sp.]|nr:methyltransferase domain-containing protein [Desulfovibrio sp.]